VNRFTRPSAAFCAACLLLAGQAQGGTCAMCKENAKALGENGQAAINDGIILLMLSVVGVLGGLALAAWRRLKAEQES